MKPDIIVISKQKAKDTIIKTRFVRRFFIAFGRSKTRIEIFSLNLRYLKFLLFRSPNGSSTGTSFAIELSFILSIFLISKNKY